MNTSTALTLDLRSLAGTWTGAALQRALAVVDPLVLVGGTVRDLLLGRESHDLDLVVPSGGLELARRLSDALGGAFVALDEARDTGRVVLSGPASRPLYIDVAAWRGPSLADDLRGRDFTINALAAKVAGAEAHIVDVTGGLADLDARLLRTASPQALIDDPLRSLRAVRLVAELSPWGFRLEHGSARQIREHAPLVAATSVERIRDELVRILAADRPARWLAMLSDLGLLAVTLPEVEPLRGVLQPAPHIYDVYDHTLHAVECAAWLADWIAGEAEPADDHDAAVYDALEPLRPALAQHCGEALGAVLANRSQALRWAALSHDWGKPATRTVAAGGANGQPRIQFLGHEEVSANLARTALRRLRFSDAEVRWMTTVVAGHMRPHHLAAADAAPSRRAVYRYFRDLGPAGVDTALFSLADLRAIAGSTLQAGLWQRQLDVVFHLLDAYFNRPSEAVRPSPLIDGHSLMAALDLPPGRQIGRLLEAVAEAQAAGELHSREQALAYAAHMVETLPASN